MRNDFISANSRVEQREQSGFALVVVLLVIVILSTLVIEFLFASRVNMSLAAMYRESLSARYLALGGVNTFEGILRAGNFPSTDYAVGYCYKGIGCNDMLAPDPFAGKEFSDMERGTWGVGVKDFALTEGETFNAVITDERSRINLNAIVQFDLQDSHNDKQAKEVYDRIKALILLAANLTEGLDIGEAEATEFCDALVDWIDRNQDGPYENVYSGLPDPYEPRNGPLQTVGEIKLVKGMTDQLFKAISEYLTVYPVEAVNKVQYDYSISFDHASKLVLAAYFYGFTDPTTGTSIMSIEEALDGAEDIIAERDELTSAMSDQKVLAVLAKFSMGKGPHVQRWFYKSNKGSHNYFRLTSEGMVGNVTTRIETVMRVEGSAKIERLFWREE